MLDVGCGEGYILEEIRKEFPYLLIEASDVEPEAVEMAKNNLENLNLQN